MVNNKLMYQNVLVSTAPVISFTELKLLVNNLKLKLLVMGLILLDNAK